MGAILVTVAAAGESAEFRKLGFDGMSEPCRLCLSEGVNSSFVLLANHVAKTAPPRNFLVRNEKDEESLF